MACDKCGTNKHVRTKANTLKVNNKRGVFLMKLYCKRCKKTQMFAFSRMGKTFTINEIAQ